MPDQVPALRQVQQAFRDQVAASVTYLADKIFIDRADTEPLSQAERPGMVIRITNVTFEQAQDGKWSTRHRATLQVDCHSHGQGGETIDGINQRTLADVVAAVHADRTLGGRLESLEEQAASGSEQDGADIGCAILELEAAFITPRGNFYKILGQGGQEFTS